MRRFFALTAISSILSVAPVAAKPPASPPQDASIPFANHGGIYDWEVADRTTLYIQARDRKWYRATVDGTCRNLQYVTIKLVFDTGPSDAFDRFSHIIADGERCDVTSLVPSGPPPRKKK